MALADERARDEDQRDRYERDDACRDRPSPERIGHAEAQVPMSCASLICWINLLDGVAPKTVAQRCQEPLAEALLIARLDPCEQRQRNHRRR